MIENLFYFLFTVAIIFQFYGWYVRADLYRLTGSLLLFLLGATLTPAIPSLVGDFEIKTGFTETVNGSETITVFNYAPYTNHTLGFYTSILGILSFILIMVDRRQEATGE